MDCKPKDEEWGERKKVLTQQTARGHRGRTPHISPSSPLNQTKESFSPSLIEKGGGKDKLAFPMQFSLSNFLPPPVSEPARHIFRVI